MNSPNRKVRSITGVVLVLLIAGCSSDSSDITPPPTVEPPLTSGSVVVNRTSVLLTAPGQSRQLTVQTKNGSGSAVSAAVSWSSSAPEQVSVDANGRVTARAIGSAMIFAISGAVKSTPVFVVVAEPQPGALIVNDAQVLAVGLPIGVAPGHAPTLGTRYDVRLTGIATPPSLGTVVLASENAPVSGKVVAVRNESGAMVVTLAMAPLRELLARYDINLRIDLDELSASTNSGTGAGSANRSVSLDSSTRAAASILSPVTALSCSGNLSAGVTDMQVQLAPTMDLTLEVVDNPGRVRRAIVGTQKLVGSIVLKLRADVRLQGACDARVPIVIPLGGPLAIGVAPGVQLGVGVSLSGQIAVTAGELSLTGELGAQLEVGWECGGPSASCQSLDKITPIENFKPKYEVFNPRKGLRVELEGQFYVFASLDAVFATVFHAGILEAKAGPVQSVDLAWEEDQLNNPGYASKYDLKLEAVVQPGSALQEVLDNIGRGLISLTFRAKVSKDISESPKGTLSASKSVAGLEGGPVEIRVDLSNTNYFLYGYNVVKVDLWKKRKTDGEFEQVHTFAGASNQTIFTHVWQPTPEDLGVNEFAAIVYTQFPVPGLEVAENSITKVDVKCFTAPRVIAAVVAEANSCADTWVGTATFDWPGELHIDATVTWTRDPANPENVGGGVYYVATGQAVVKHLGWENKGCSVSQSVYPIGPQVTSDYLFVDYRPEKPTFEGNGGIAGVSQLTCPDGPPIDYAFGWLWWNGAGELTGNGTIVEGTLKLGEGTWQWRFTRP